MKDAARTTVLSHRWKNLWTHTTGSLDFFEGSSIMWSIKLLIMDSECVGDTPFFVKCVNRILALHKGATINGFRVHFNLDSSYRSYIDSWINFALQTRARRLELDLKRIYGSFEDMYPFPAQFLIGHPSINNSLTHLRLNYVDVTRELLEYLLSDCPFLEFVSVICSQSLVGAKVVAASPKLEYLEISDCNSVEFLEISSAINLRSFKYSGPDASLIFNDIPNLADVSFGEGYCEGIVEKFQRRIIPLSQIEKLELDVREFDLMRYEGFPELKKLKQLKLVVKGWDDDTLLRYAPLLEKCPMLYRLCVLIEWFSPPREIIIHEMECRLECLRFVEISGFRGSRADVELTTFLVTNAPYLENITIDTRHPPNPSGTLLDLVQKIKVTIKERARRLLLTKLSPGVEFLIL